MQSYIHDGLLVLSRRSCLLHRDAVGAQPPGTNQRSINNLRGTQGVLLRCTIETVRCALVSIASQPWDGETKAFLILASTWPHPICFFPWPLHYLWHLFGLAVLVVWLGTTSTNCKRGTQDNEATRGVFRRRVRIRVHPNAPPSATNAAMATWWTWILLLCVERARGASEFVDRNAPRAWKARLNPQDAPPVLFQPSANYYAELNITLPYGNITESLAAYVAENGNLRMDFNGGINSFSYTDGTSSEIEPTTLNLDGTNKTMQVQETCFVYPNHPLPTAKTPIFPDVSFYVLKEQTERVRGIDCWVWEHVQKEYTHDMLGTYRWYQSIEDGNPVRFYMMGRNILTFESHYDEYIIDYFKYEPLDSFPKHIFDPPKHMDCLEPPPQMGMKFKTALLDLHMFHPEAHLEMKKEKFDEHCANHGKIYEEPSEYAKRAVNFHHSLRLINTSNRKGLSYTLELNHMADWTPEERAMLLGRKRAPRPGPTSRAEGTYLPRNTVLPYNVDWRNHSAVTSVKDQGTCGSCWSFGAAGAMESHYYLKTGHLIDLSEQSLMDCSWNDGNLGCDGGYDYAAYNWVIDHGIPAEGAYGGYLNQDGVCHFAIEGSNVPTAAFITSYLNITSGDMHSLNDALAFEGPLSVSLNTPDSLYFYSHGLYYNSDCLSGEDDLDHTVLAVGYITVGEERYTIIKNSWSTNWGEDGYVYISQKDNICGIATEAVLVQIDWSQSKENGQDAIVQH